MLQHLIKKYKEKDVEQVVYRLSYAGKFVIVKGRTLCGSLIIISNTFDQFARGKERFKEHLYVHLYNHFIRHKGKRVTIRMIAKASPDTNQYQLLKREQMELDKHRYNKKCLNNATEAYVPDFNEETQMYGWLEKTAVMNFKRWLKSKERAAYIKRYGSK